MQQRLQPLHVTLFLLLLLTGIFVFVGCESSESEREQGNYSYFISEVSSTAWEGSVQDIDFILKFDADGDGFIQLEDAKTIDFSYSIQEVKDNDHQAIMNVTVKKDQVDPSIETLANGTFTVTLTDQKELNIQKSGLSTKLIPAEPEL